MHAKSIAAEWLHSPCNLEEQKIVQFKTEAVYLSPGLKDALVSANEH